MTSHVNRSSILQKTFIESSIKILQPRTAYQLSEDTSCAEVLKTLHARNLDCVLLHNQERKLSGIFSERDLITKRLSISDPRVSSPISDFMTRNPEFLKANASVARAFHLMGVGGFRHIPIVPMAGDVLQIISSTDLFRFIQEKITSRVVQDDIELVIDGNALDQFFISDLSIFKFDPHLAFTPDTSILEVIQKMSKAKQSAAFVLSNDGTAQGIFTERDFLRKVATSSSSLAEITISSMMTSRPRTLISTASVAFAFSTLVEGGFRNLPIVDTSERLIGVLGVKHFIDYMAKQIIAVLDGG